MDGVTIPATCRVWLPCGSLRRERERQAVTVSPLERKKMLASVCSSRRVVPPMEPPHTAKAFPNCGQESHTLVQVLTLILKITVLTPISAAGHNSPTNGNQHAQHTLDAFDFE